MERRLGRGLGSLLGQSEVLEVHKDPKELPVGEIHPNPFQPRRRFDEAALEELAHSLSTHGVLQPVVVRQGPSGFELISGERRWRAARKAGLAKLPVVIRSGVTDQEMLELALVENIQRSDLDPIERAQAFQSMLETLRITQDELAKRVGMQRTTVSNHLRLLSLPEPIRDAVANGLISMGHAKAILSLVSPQAQVLVMQRAAREGLSVRQVEALCQAEGRAREPAASRPDKQLTPHVPWITEIEARLRESLGTKVSVLNSKGYRGKIVIEYFDRAGLERLCKVLAPRQVLS